MIMLYDMQQILGMSIGGWLPTNPTKEACALALGGLSREPIIEVPRTMLFTSEGIIVSDLLNMT